MSAHTPGPWYVAPDDRYSMTHLDVCHTDVHTPGAASEVIAKVTCRVSWMMEQTANACLIAAAPDLLRELKILRACLHPWIEAGHRVPGIATLNGADAAIAKAEGHP